MNAIHFDIFTLFPQMFSGPLSESILKIAQEKGLCSVSLHNIRAYSTDRHHTCDATPYGGGGGMLMKPEPIFRAVETVLTKPAGWVLPAEDAYINLPAWSPDYSHLVKDKKFAIHASHETSDHQQSSKNKDPSVPIILLTPQGRLLTQKIVAELSRYPRLALICGRYEGVDERVRTQLVTDEISIGDYVLSGGELASMVLLDSITRLIPGVLGHELSAEQDSHSPGLGGLLEGPQYTRPHTFRGESIPDVLLSGHHANVDRWRHQQALKRTFERRPDLLSQYNLSDDDKNFLDSVNL